MIARKLPWGPNRWHPGKRATARTFRPRTILARFVLGCYTGHARPRLYLVGS